MFLMLLGATCLSFLILFVEFTLGGGQQGASSRMNQEMKRPPRWQTWAELTEANEQVKDPELLNLKELYA